MVLGIMAMRFAVRFGWALRASEFEVTGDGI